MDRRPNAAISGRGPPRWGPAFLGLFVLSGAGIYSYHQIVRPADGSGPSNATLKATKIASADLGSPAYNAMVVVSPMGSRLQVPHGGTQSDTVSSRPGGGPSAVKHVFHRVRPAIAQSPRTERPQLAPIIAPAVNSNIEPSGQTAPSGQYEEGINPSDDLLQATSSGADEQTVALAGSAVSELPDGSLAPNQPLEPSVVSAAKEARFVIEPNATQGVPPARDGTDLAEQRYEGVSPSGKQPSDSVQHQVASSLPEKGLLGALHEDQPSAPASLSPDRSRDMQRALTVAEQRGADTTRGSALVNAASEQAKLPRKRTRTSSVPIRLGSDQPTSGATASPSSQTSYLAHYPVVVVNGQELGAVTLHEYAGQSAIHLGTLVTLFRWKLGQVEFDRLRSAAAADQYIDLQELEQAGFDVRYDTRRERLTLELP